MDETISSPTSFLTRLARECKNKSIKVGAGLNKPSSSFLLYLHSSPEKERKTEKERKKESSLARSLAFMRRSSPPATKSTPSAARSRALIGAAAEISTSRISDPSYTFGKKFLGCKTRGRKKTKGEKQCVEEDIYQGPNATHLPVAGLAICAHREHLGLVRAVCNLLEHGVCKENLIAHKTCEIPNNARAVRAGRNTLLVILPHFDVCDLALYFIIIIFFGIHKIS